MYQINEEVQKEPYTMLIPAMLDAHFPLLKYAFYSKKFRPVILEEEKDIVNTGLMYTHNDMCYPLILIIGQMITALQSGKYDIDKTVLMIPQAGDACRGSNYIHMIRKAIKKAGFEKVPVISLNVKGFEKNEEVPISIGMGLRALAGTLYGDMLMILSNQIRPYEKNTGETDRYVMKWTKKLQEELKQGKHLSFHAVKKNMAAIALDFTKIQRIESPTKKIGIVGEIYIKYCHLGNWHLEQFLQEEGCEYYINGLSWYALYYMDTHLTEEGLVMKSAYQIGMKVIEAMQNAMCRALTANGFYVMPPYTQFKKQASKIIDLRCGIGDGWLIAAESIAHAKGGYESVLGVQPFGCLPNQLCGKGIYPFIGRKLTNLQIMSIDYDASGNEVNVKNRVKLLLNMATEK